MVLVLATTALVVAMIYVLIALLVVPRIELEGLGSTGTRIFRLGAIVFFLGCGVTHVHVAVQAFSDPSSATMMTLGVHLVQIAGGIAFLVASLRMVDIKVAARRSEVESMRIALLRDPLTGVSNRRYLDESLTPLLFDLHRLGSIALIMLDIDDFKAINDSAGHAAGDKVLKRFAMTVAQLLRAEDTISRIGGDEFVIVLPGVDRHRASVVADRILEASASVSVEGVPRVSISIGIAVAPQDGNTADDLIHVADTAMYVAKQAGGAQWRGIESVSHSLVPTITNSDRHDPVAGDLGSVATRPVNPL